MNSLLSDLAFKAAPKDVFVDLTPEELESHMVESGVARRSKTGALVVNSGEHTGRAAKDKYIVETSSTSEKVWWENAVHKMTTETFHQLKEEIITYLSSGNSLYIKNRTVGAHADHQVGARVITPSPTHALFSHYMFRDEQGGKHMEDFCVLHAPELRVDPKKFGTKSGTVIVTNFDEKLILICGTKYCGEIKKSLFSVMNFILPDYDILPMHAGANIRDDKVSVFFGLSGTGKTTLSTDEGFLLIGDDEHGLSSNGIFNFEGGCYAKTIRLNEEAEPGIYAASTHPRAILENVVMKEDGSLDFDDASITENGRSSYPLDWIPDIKTDSQGPVPTQIFFLTADAFGVLPPIAKLTEEQAMDYFMLGYTAKLAGTEMGVTEPEAAFSPFFGAPFMGRKPKVYAELLKTYMTKFNIPVWLVNTGWTAGPYGEGHRYSIQDTRTIIRSVQAGKLGDAEFENLPHFNISIPKNIEGVDSNIFNPRNTWKNKEAYDAKARELADKFTEVIQKYKSVR